MTNQFSMRILSVDDNVDNRYLLESTLGGGGYLVTCASNGAEALEILRSEHFDLILADVLMPLMDGFELCRRVKHQEATRDIPFVFYTATYTEKKDEELALSLGASGFIVKPIEPERFLKIVRDVINKAQRGELKPSQPSEDQETLLRSYNLRLIRKLDKKVGELETISRALQVAVEAKEHELLERRRVEAEVRALNVELEDRVQCRTRELTIANRELQAFVSAVSHDLRSPLKRMHGLAELLVEDYADNLPVEGREIEAAIVADSRRMHDLVEALFKLSQVTHGHLRKVKVDLSVMASEIVSGLRNQQSARSVDFILAPSLVTNGDPVLLRLALQNLLDNAWKFTSKRAHARIEFGVISGDHPTFFIRDNGAGFDGRRAKEVFAPFQRLHSVEEFPGTGIGLATVQQIISRHDGEIWAEGAPDKGATFFFTLP